MIIREGNNFFIKSNKNVLVSNSDFGHEVLVGVSIMQIISMFDDYGIRYSIIFTSSNNMEDIMYLEESFSEV